MKSRYDGFWKDATMMVIFAAALILAGSWIIG
jgi:hypothetical protein